MTPRLTLKNMYIVSLHRFAQQCKWKAWGTIVDKPTQILLRQSHLHSQSKGGQDIETSLQGLFILKTSVTTANHLINANIPLLQSMELKHTETYVKLIYVDKIDAYISFTSAKYNQMVSIKRSSIPGKKSAWHWNEN